MNVRAMVMDLGEIGAQRPRDLDRRLLKIDCIDFHLCADLARELDDQSGNITGSCRQIEDAQFVTPGESSDAKKIE